MNPKLRMIPKRLRYITDDENVGGGGASDAEQVSTEAPDGEQPAEKDDAEKTSDEDGEAEEEKDATWLNKELERTRRESANYRTQLREAQDALAAAKSPEDVEAAVKELSDKLAASDAALLRERVARKAGLPDALIERLKGSTEEELLADATELSKLLAPARQVDAKDLDGGLSPDDETGAFDPVKQAARGRRRY